MRNKKDISIDDFEFYISFNDHNTDLDSINEINVHNLIVISFIPKTKLNESDGNKIMEKYHSYFLKEIRLVVEENSEFYNKLNVAYRFNGGGSYLISASGRNLLLKMERNLFITLK